MPEGHQIVLSEASDELYGYSPGDVIVSLSTVKRDQFERKGDDLWTTETITLLESLVGFKLVLDHLDGHTVNYSKDNITYHGEVVKIPNEGMPRTDDDLRGYLFVKFLLEFPDYLTPEQKKEIRNLLKDVR